MLCGLAAATAPVSLLKKIPQSLSEIDNGKILGFGSDLAVDHPVRLLPRKMSAIDSLSHSDLTCHEPL